jgi:hypothetical protein
MKKRVAAVLLVLAMVVFSGVDWGHIFAFCIPKLLLSIVQLIL